MSSGTNRRRRTRRIKAWHERCVFLSDIAMICMKPDHGKRNAHPLMVTCSVTRPYDARKPQINILSVQSSKGLEFRSVIFIGLGQVETSETLAAQNMKLLYAGMTRAKERLLITASGRN